MPPVVRERAPWHGHGQAAPTRPARDRTSEPTPAPLSLPPPARSAGYGLGGGIALLEIAPVNDAPVANASVAVVVGSGVVVLAATDAEGDALTYPPSPTQPMATTTPPTLRQQPKVSFSHSALGAAGA